jgi:hypothetical protein
VLLWQLNQEGYVGLGMERQGMHRLHNFGLECVEFSLIKIYSQGRRVIGYVIIDRWKVYE